MTAARLSAPVVIALGLLAAIGPFATDLYLPSFPLVSADLGVGASQVQLTLTGFMVGMALGQLFWGPISDRFGRRLPLIIAAVILVAASIATALSGSIEVLIVSRVVQGLAASAGMVVGRALGRDLATGPALARLYSVLAVIIGIAPIVAPILGGLIVGTVGWRGVLWVVALFTAAVLIVTLIVVPETLPPDRRAPSGIAQLGRNLATVLGDRSFVGLALVQGFGFGAIFSYVSASSFVLQDQYGLTGTAYSIVFAAGALGLVLGGILNGRLVGILGEQRIFRAAIIALIVSTVALTILAVALQLPPLAVVVGLIVIASACGSPILANSSTIALGGHGAGTAGIAAALIGAVQFGLAGAISPLASIAGAASVASMALTMACSALCAGVAYLVLCRPRSTPQGSDGSD